MAGPTWDETAEITHAGPSWDETEDVSAPPVETNPSDSPMTAATTGLANGATLGFADEIGAAGKTAMNALTGITGPLAGQPLSDIGDDYSRTRDQLRGDFDQAAQASPKTALAANIAGAIASPLSTLGPRVASGNGLGASVANSVAQGASQGALMGAGNSEADTVGGLAQDTAIGTGLGALGGAAGGSGSQVANRTGGAVAGKLGTAADELATSPWVRKGAQNVAEDLANNASGLSGIANKYVLSPAVKKGTPWVLDRLSEAVRATPQVFGKFAKPMQAAAERGGNALNATHFILQQTNPEYREMMRSLQGDDQESEDRTLAGGQR